jgi:SAM-dependent methyltransferase
MRTTLFRLLKALTEAVDFPEPVYEFGAYRVAGQEGRGCVRDYFPRMEYVACDLRAGPSVDRIENLHYLTLPDESMGTALLFDTIEHVREPWQAIGEIYRCLRPGGIVVMTSVMYFPIHAHPNDYWRFTGSGFSSLLQAFKVICVESCGLKKLPHTIVGIAAKQTLDSRLEDSLREAVIFWKRRGASSWKEIAMAVLPPVLLIPAYDLFALLLEVRGRSGSAKR